MNIPTFCQDTAASDVDLLVVSDHKAGQVLRSGVGVGEAEIVVQVRDADAPGKIRGAIAAARPQAKYRIVREDR